MARKHSNWIDGFLAYSSCITSPEPFRKWAAISAVASAMQRRCYTFIVGRQQFPNLYILLVSPPGVGKTAAIVTCRDICRQHPSIKLTPTRITAQALYIDLENSKQAVTDITDPEKPINMHSSLTAMIDELGTFIKKGDIDFMADLADLYDCHQIFEYKTKTQGENYAEATWFNFIGGCTPYTLKETFSNDAIEMGFPARIVMVFDETKIKHESLFTSRDKVFENKEDDPAFQALASDLEEILHISGEYVWSSEARDFLSDWYADDLRPYPNDVKLVHYCTRRLTHVTKLAMVFTAAKSNDLVIPLQSIQRAKSTLLETEQVMEGATSALGGNEYYVIQAELLKWIRTEFLRRKKPIPEPTVSRRLARETAPHLVEQIIQQLVNMKYLKVIGPNTTPDRLFEPMLVERKREGEED